jgi:hypothetical protein
MRSRLHLHACVPKLLRCRVPPENAALLALLIIGLHAPAAFADPPWLEVPFVHQVKAGCGSAASRVNNLDGTNVDGADWMRICALKLKTCDLR